MLSNTRIILNRLSFVIDERRLFTDLNLTFLTGKYGLIGRNGMGKSTLLKLIAGEILPSAGGIQIEGHLAYCPQELIRDRQNQTVAEVLGAAEKLRALARIYQGSVDQQDFLLVGDDWCFQENLQHQLRLFGLDGLDLERHLKNLSGGELTRLMLAKIFLSDADYILLDEPTNNLDSASRQALYQAIENWSKGLLVVSHDRELLQLMDHIVEISSLGVNLYGGNYADYCEQKEIENAAAQQSLQTANQIKARAKKLTQERKERHERAQAKGRRARKEEIAGVGKLVSRIEFNSAKGRSEKTLRKINLQSEQKVSRADQLIQMAKSKIENNRNLNINLAHTQIPKGKMVLTMTNVIFKYLAADHPIIDHFNLEIQGPERIALVGNNGSGKTTLVKLILHELIPLSGEIEMGVERVSYLDQKLEVLNPNLSILDNFLKINSEVQELKARYYLADFLFRGDSVLKLVGDLSSGEKLRAALACLLMSKLPPQLLILDEPTNHLDLWSLAAIEQCLREYQGAIIVISHDHRFLENLKINKTIVPSQQFGFSML